MPDTKIVYRSTHPDALAHWDRTASAAAQSDLAARVAAAVYDELCMRPGPSRNAAGKARAAGFAPPLAWSDGRVDNPCARPAGVRDAIGGAL